MKDKEMENSQDEKSKTSKGKKIIIGFWRHKYIWTFILFFIIVGFLDPNSLLRRYNQQRRIHELNSEIEEHQKKYDEDMKKLNELDRNPQSMEKIARERYFMKTDNEDVYVIDNGTKDNEQTDETTNQ